MTGPFFQNPNNYPMLLSHPAHKGAVQVPAKKVVEGIYYKKFPFLVEVKNPKPDDIVFSQTAYEDKQLPLQKAEPLPNTTTGVAQLEEPVVEETENTEEEAEEVSEDTEDAESESEPSSTAPSAPEAKGSTKVPSKKNKKKGKK